MAGVKRQAKVPEEALMIAENVSKSDLLEVAWSLASLCNDGEGCDDEEATLRRLCQELQTMREARGGKPIPTLEAFRQKWAALRREREEWAARSEAMAAEKRQKRIAATNQDGGHVLRREVGKPGATGECEKCGWTNVWAGGPCSANAGGNR